MNPSWIPWIVAGVVLFLAYQWWTKNEAMKAAQGAAYANAARDDELAAQKEQNRAGLIAGGIDVAKTGIKGLISMGSLVEEGLAAFTSNIKPAAGTDNGAAEYDFMEPAQL